MCVYANLCTTHVPKIIVLRSVAAWQPSLGVANSAGDIRMQSSASSRVSKSALKAAAAGGGKRSVSESMTDALAESLGVGAGGDGGEQERFKVLGVRQQRES